MISTAAVSRLVLVPSTSAPTDRSTTVRRYRLARLRLNDRPDPEHRFAHLKRTYD